MTAPKTGPEHSPLPWKEDKSVMGALRDRDGKLIARTNLPGDASLIAESVNSDGPKSDTIAALRQAEVRHADLTTAFDAVVKALDDIEQRTRLTRDKELNDIARAALALAKGRGK